ncbi:MAG: Crp/Fnr family transcriptional regulator [Bacillaceae bacterium]|nr:Crp/Fnr family transcriptional regulator [Bacillaceae bacterium]
MSSNPIKQILRNVSLFKELTDSELQTMMDIAHTKTFLPGKHVFMQGDPLERVFFIHQGKVKIYKTDIHGKEQIVSVLQKGDMFPHTGFFKKGTYPAHAEMMEETTLIIIKVKDFEYLLLTYPEMAVKLFRIMGDKIVDLQNRLEEQILHNTYGQVIMLLIRLSKSYGKNLGDTRVKLTSHFTNRELANMIGTSRETVSRTINALKKQNLVETGDDGLLIIDPDALQDELLDV